MAKTFDLQLILTAKDLANRQLKTLQDNVNASRNTINQLGQAAIIGFGAVSTAIGIGIKKASDFQEVQSKFETVFKEQTGKAEELAIELQDAYAMSETAAKRNLSAVQDLLVPMGLARDEAINFADGVVKLASDLGSFNNLPTETVMLDIQSALVGNFETMKKYGVVLNEGTIKQRALNDGLSDGKTKITAAEKAMIAYKLILEGSQDASGDMERTSKNFANQLKFLNSGMDDIVTNLGKSFLPLATKYVNIINDEIIPSIKDWVTNTENIEKISKNVESAMKKLQTVFIGIIATVDILGSTLGTLSASVILQFTNIKGTIKDFLKSLVGINQTAKKNSSVIGESFDEIGNKIIKYSELIEKLTNKRIDVTNDESKKIIEANDKSTNNYNKNLENITTLTKEEISKQKKFTIDFLDFQIESGQKTLEDKKMLLEEELSFLQSHSEKTIEMKNQELEIMKELYSLEQQIAEESHNNIGDSFKLMLEEMKKSQIDWYKTIGELRDGFIGNTADGFEFMLTNIGKGWDVLNDGVTQILHGMRDTIIKVASDMAAEWVIKTGIMKAATLVWKGVEIAAAASVAAARAVASAIGSLGIFGIPAAIAAASSIKGIIEAFADGVRGFGGGLAIVGERGPEMLRLPNGTDVLTNSETRNMLSAGNGQGMKTIIVKNDFSNSNFLGTKQSFVNEVSNIMFRNLQLQQNI